MKLAQSMYQLTFLIVLLSVFAGYNFMFADAPASPPTNNVSAPVTVSATNQIKNGALSLAGLLVSGNVVVTGATATFNQARAAEYCDQVGANCFTAATVNGVVPSVQFFGAYGGSGKSAVTTSLGSGWAMCALSKQHTGADDNNMKDHCEVVKNVDGSWSLLLGKSTEDWLACGAVCLDLSGEITQPVYTYNWDATPWSGYVPCGFGDYTQTRTVSCMRNNGDVVSDSLCAGPKPASSQTVERPTCHERPEN